MSSLGETLRRIRYLLFRGRYTADLEAEIRLHMELRARQLHDEGLPASDAYWAARRRFGHPIIIQERSRDMWGLHLIEHAIADLHFAVRRLRRHVGFSIATISVAALGIGAVTAVFSAVDAALVRPLPFVRPNELFSLTNVNMPFDQRFGGPNDRHLMDITDVGAMTDVFSSTAAFAAGGLNLSDATSPQRVRAGVVTTAFFSTLGVRTQAGRTFTTDEGRPKGPKAVVISDALWRSHFGATPVVGTTIELSGARYTVVGIMEPKFNFPNESDLWIPLTVPTTSETFAPFRGFLPSQVIARTAPGVTPAVAGNRLKAKWLQLAGPPDPKRRSNLDNMIDEVKAKPVVSLQRTLVGTSETPLVILLGATALLLLIASANVANLLLSDAASRRREIALREVLGATRSRIVRQLLAESLVLSFSGAAIGIALSPAVLGLLRAMMPVDLAGVAPASIDLRVLAFATLLAIVTGLAFGLWPALGAANADGAETIKSGGYGATAGGAGRARRALIVAELALTVMLLVGSGLMLRSLDRVLSQDTGMNTEHVGTLELSFPRGVKSAARLARLHDIVAHLERDPGIQSAAIVNDLPLRGSGGISLLITVDGAPRTSPMDDSKFSRFLIASGGYFKALGIPLKRGRTFTTSDDSLSPPVAVINEAMAKKWWPATDPIGKTFHFPADTVPVTVVGLVADVREVGLERELRPQAYFSVDRQAPQNIAVVARGTLPEAALLARLRDAVRAADPAQAVYNVRMMDAVLASSVAPRRTNTTLITIFGALALLLSAFGVYAVVSYSVARRAREFGIRAALGATKGSIAALVGREMAMSVVLGVAIGLAGAWALVRVMAALLYGVEAHDVATFALAPVLLVVPAAIATLVPARRAMRVNPIEVMRAE